MKAPSYISDELQKDLNQYSSSLSCESIEFNSVCEIEDEEEKKQISEDIKTIIIPKFQNDQVVITFNQDQNKLIFLTSKLNTSSSVPTSEICEKIKSLILNKTCFRLLVDSYEKVQNSIKESAEINTLLVSGREVEKNDDNSLVNLLLYSSEDLKQNLEERVKRVFKSYILSTEKIEISKDNVDKNQIKYFKKLLKDEEIKNRLLNDFGIKNFSLIKEKKIRYLKVEILSSKLKDFTNKKNKDNLTIHNIYKKFDKYLDGINETDEFKLDENQINAFIRFLSPLDIFKRNHQGSIFSLNISSKFKSEFNQNKEIKCFNYFLEKVAKVRLPYSIPDNFNLPRLMIYNALLVMKNNEEDELETLYGDKEVKITKGSDKLAITFGDKMFNLMSRPKANLLISFASDSNKKTIEDSFVEGILSDSIELEEESTKLDTSSRYIWECFDKNREFCDRIVFSRTKVKWCPYDFKNFKLVQAFEIEYQKQLKIRQELREEITKKLDNDKDRLKELKRIKKKKEEEKEEQGEDEEKDEEEEEEEESRNSSSDEKPKKKCKDKEKANSKRKRSSNRSQHKKKRSRSGKNKRKDSRDSCDSNNKK